MIDLIYEKSNEFKTIYKLKQFCMIINKLFIHFKNCKISNESIVNFSYTLLSLKDGTGNEFKRLEIEPQILRELLLYRSWDFCGNSQILYNYMAIIHAFKILNTHLCIYGPPEIGKTSSILSLGEIINNKCEIHSFNGETIPDYYYGIKEKKNIEENGSLKNSLISGHIFIAENLNLSSESTIKAMAPALEINYSGKIYFPGIENPIKINPNFFFVVCQNEFGTKGRNKLPKNISRKLKTIFYPSLCQYDIEGIINEIKNKLDLEYHYKKQYASFRIDTEEFVEFIFTLNKKKLYKNNPWSFKDIKIIFQRQFLQSSDIHIY